MSIIDFIFLAGPGALIVAVGLIAGLITWADDAIHALRMRRATRAHLRYLRNR